MATIAQNIASIRSAVYGSQVRSAIADALQQCYDAVNNTNNAAIETLSNTVDSNYTSLSGRITSEAQSRSAKDRAIDADISALSQRVTSLNSNFTSLSGTQAADKQTLLNRIQLAKDDVLSQLSDLGSTHATDKQHLLNRIQLAKEDVLSQLSNLGSTHGTDISRLSSRLSGISENVSAMQQAIETLSTRTADVATLRSRLENLATTIAALQSAIAVIDAGSGASMQQVNEALQALSDTLGARIDSAIELHTTELNNAKRELHAETVALEGRMVEGFVQRDHAIGQARQEAHAENVALEADLNEQYRYLEEKHDREVRNVRREIGHVNSYAVGIATRHENDMENMRAGIEIVSQGIAEVKEAQESLVSDILKDGDSFYGVNLKGNRITQYITGIGGSGGGSGGGGSGTPKVETKISMTMPVMTPENGQVRKGDPLLLNFSWSSILDNQPTGKGTISVYVKNVKKVQLKNRSQGDIQVDIGPYLEAGSSTIRVEITDSYDNSTYRRFDVECVELLLTSTFNSSTTYTGPIMFRCTPRSSGEKTIHVKLDDTELEPMTTLSQREVTYSIPEQTHGKHTLEAWYTIELNGETLESNHLYYEFIALEIGEHEKIFVSDFNTTEMEQYDSTPIVFKAYDPDEMTMELSFYENNTLKYSGTFDRGSHTYMFRADNAGTVALKVMSGETVLKEWTITVTPTSMDIHAETDGLALYLTPVGRSNSEQNPATWGYNDIPVTLEGIDWDTDGWQTDSDGDSLLRLRRGGSVSIDFKPFLEDIRSSGMLIEIEFATRNIDDFDTVACSCYSGGRGFFIKPNRAELHSESASLQLDLMEETHTRLSFAIDKRSDGSMMMAYINSIPQQAVKYPEVDDFSQVTPVGITFGSEHCDVDIYCIRIYNHNLLPKQILDNFIADTQNGQLKRERYLRNDIYDDEGNIDPAKLPIDLPYMVIECTALPNAKLDEGVPCSLEYVDQQDPDKSFTAIGVEANGQGTTSIKYPVKNFDLKCKKGFETQNGHITEYALVDSILPFNRFVLKADYASSEGANNVEFVKLFNDLNPYIKREREANPKVRDGIYGLPIVLFHRDPDTKAIRFVGKYNFNLPKRAAGPYGYSGNQESWEFENNSPGLMWFTSDVFDETLVQHPDTGEMVPKWTLDFEARFPDSSWMDYSKLQELETFVVSTNRDTATNSPLPQPVVYNGTSYNTDSAEYRLAKFHDEFPSYAQLESFLYYYVMGEWALDMDGWGKNLFIGFVGDDVTAEGHVADRKAITEPYDKDTLWGINNEGVNVFPYWIENTDTLNGKRPHTSYGSVLWNNLRDAFPAEISQMYGNLRGRGLSYENVEAMMEEHQSHWPEAIWIDDTWYKYIDQPTTDHWPKLQGDKRQQRRYFMSKRTRYYDSKWNAGDAKVEAIQLRGYAKADITLKTRMKMYPTVIWASTYMTQQRAEANETVVMHCPLQDMNDTEIYIHSAPEITSVGDLTGLKAGEAIFSYARNLSYIQMGKEDTSYENPNLHKFEAGSESHPMPLLTGIDIRGCTGLGRSDTSGHVQETVDLRWCEQLEEFLAERTNILGVQLPRGTRIQSLHLPSTITSLVLLGAKKLNDLVVPIGNNFSTLWIEDCPQVDTKALLLASAAATRVRLIGVNWECETGDDAVALFEHISLMRGLDENGDAPTPNIAQISGSVHVGTLSAENNAALEQLGYPQNFPYLTLTYDHTAVTLTYKTYDGSSIIATETVIDGGDGTRVNNTSRASTAQYDYTPNGWSLTPNGSANASALTNMTSNRTVYAAYTSTTRNYTATFVRASDDGGGTLYIQTNVPYGTTPSYSGSTPTTTKGTATEYPFIGWSPALASITGNTTYTAQFQSPKEIKEITDSWDTVFAALDDGSYANKYKVGNYKTIDLGTEGSGNLYFVAKDTDECANGSGMAPISCVVGFALRNSRRMNPAYAANTEGTGTLGGWDKSEMKQYLLNTIMPLIPAEIRSRIVPVKKYTKIRRASDETEVYNVETIETCYLLSHRELFADGGYETMGPVYGTFFSDSESRRMFKPGSTNSNIYWSRTALTTRSYRVVSTSGMTTSDDAEKSYVGIVFGFCLGTYEQLHTKGTIADLKAAVIDGTYSTKYAPGDMFTVEDDGEGSPNAVQILGFNKDELADGSGNTAKIAAAYYYALPNNRRMNPIYVANTEGTGALGGWEKTEMWTYLRETLYPNMNSDLKSMIVPVKKYTRIYQASDETAVNNVETTETVYLLSYREVIGSFFAKETIGPIYSDVFTGGAANKRRKRTSTSSTEYWLRSATDASRFLTVNRNGSYQAGSANANNAVLVGFCLDVPST